jgi:hypothetical protein
MTELRVTLITDGSSDIMLLPVLEWLLKGLNPRLEIDSRWADLRQYINNPRTLEDKIKLAVEFYPCDLLFIHRDAERYRRNQRACEIAKVATSALQDHPSPPYICVVPVRMLEAWLLIEDQAIRRAAGNRNGKMDLNLPILEKLESLPDPKKVLYQALKKASGKNKHQLASFKPSSKVHLIPENLRDFSPLLGLSAFQALRKDIIYIISQQGWDN